MLEVPFVTSIHSQHCRANKRKKVRGFPSKFDQLFSHFHYLEATFGCVLSPPNFFFILFAVLCVSFCDVATSSLSRTARGRKRREKRSLTHKKKMVGRRRRQKDPSVLFLFLLRLLRAVVFIIYLLPPPHSLGLAHLLLHDRPGGKFQTEGGFWRFRPKIRSSGPGGQKIISSPPNRGWKLRSGGATFVAAAANKPR